MSAMASTRAVELADPLKLLVETDACQRCTACLAACPLAGVLPHYAGPKRLGPDLWRQQQAAGFAESSGWDSLPRDLDLCLGCRRCDVACPAGVAPSRLIVRSRLSRRHRHEWRTAWRDWFLGRAYLLGKAGTTFGPLANALLPTRPVRFVLHHVVGISARRVLPPFARRRFSSLHPPSPPPPPRPSGSAGGVSVASEGADGTGRHESLLSRKVVYFPGCQVEYYEPELGELVLNTLAGLGVETAVDEVACCGLPLIANAWSGAAQRQAAANVERLLAWVEDGWEVVLSSSSCGLTLRHDYLALNLVPPHLREAASRVSQHIYDLGLYLLRLEEEESRRRGRPVRIVPQKPAESTRGLTRIGYHTPCHVEAGASGRPWLKLLSRLPGVEVVDLQAGCCGIAGTYGLKREKYEIARAVGRGLQEAVLALDPPVVATECETCRMQIRDLVPQALVMHPLRLLGELSFV
ncbi:MAG: anaerobic glycerol-3-phosphate dehydrogenase subunit C [Limnochordales bacterium]|nr:anaerobic glycerol-3-phosphate dehydrogenase subunit C [Limnochordales bacterium]